MCNVTKANRLRGALKLLPPLLNALDRSGDGSQRSSFPSEGINNISSEAFVILKLADCGLDVVGGVCRRNADLRNKRNKKQSHVKDS